MKTMKKTPNETRKFTKHLGEKTNCPQPAWNLCSGYIPYSNVDTNGFLHLHEMPGKILGQNNNKKPKERSKQTNKQTKPPQNPNQQPNKKGGMKIQLCLAWGFPGCLVQAGASFTSNRLFANTMQATLNELSGLNFCSPDRGSHRSSVQHLKFHTKLPVSLRWDSLIASAAFIPLSPQSGLYITFPLLSTS